MVFSCHKLIYFIDICNCSTIIPSLTHYIFVLCLFHIIILFSYLLFDLVDAESESAALESKAPKETINFKEVKRIDHILASLQRKVMFV